MAEKLSLKEVRFYMRNVRTRMPFKYGAATLTSVPILHLLAQVELEDGTRATGAAGDILPPKWFDKDPAKQYGDNVEDLLFAARVAAAAYQEAGRAPRSLFALWQVGYAAVLEAGDIRGLNHLTSAHGSSLLERALFDALGRARGVSYFELLRENLAGIDLGQIHPELAGVEPGQVVAGAPRQTMYARHTVGLADPIWSAEIEQPLDDGLPQSLEEYVERLGLSFFKIKVSGDLPADVERLRSIAALLDGREEAYFATLDGNEQFRHMEGFLELVARIVEDKGLARFWQSVLYVEQPLERGIALDGGLEAGIRRAAQNKPLLVDESDGDLDVFKRAVALGYTGVSSKACKGLIKALANLALARHMDPGRYFLSGEDLMNLPVVPLHQDLAHLAALGIEHVERNGHHYVRGLDHLSPGERRACLERHADLYAEQGGLAALRVRAGRMQIGSLQVPGLGVGETIDVDSMTPLEEWEFSSLA